MGGDELNEKNFFTKIERFHCHEIENKKPFTAPVDEVKKLWYYEV